MTDAVSAAIAAAQNQAAQTPSNTGSEVSTSQQATAGLPAQGGQTRSLTDFLANAQMTVEAFLAVKDVGILIGKDKKVHDEVIVKLNAKDAKFGFSLRVSSGNSVTYHTSWDGFAEARSRENWQKLCGDAKKVDPNSYVSDLVELPVVLQQDYAAKEGPGFKAGTVVGLSLSYQNAKFFTPFLKKIVAEYGTDADLIVKITSKGRVGGGQSYGTFEFEVLRDDGQMVAAEPSKKGK